MIVVEMCLKKLLPILAGCYPFLKAVSVERKDVSTLFQLLSRSCEKLQIFRRQRWPFDPRPKCAIGHCLPVFNIMAVVCVLFYPNPPRPLVSRPVHLRSSFFAHRARGRGGSFSPFAC